MHTARNIPDAEIQQHNREVGAPNAEERVSPRQAHMLMDITGHVLVPAQRHPGLQHIAAAAKHKHAAPWGARRLLGDGTSAGESSHAAAAAAEADPVAIAAGAAVEGMARDEAKFENGIVGKINAVSSVIEGAQGAMMESSGQNATGGGGAGPVVVGSNSGSSVLSDNSNSSSSDSSAEGDTQDESEGIGIHDVGKDVTVPDPFVDESAAENTLVTTYRRVGNASSIVALLAVSSIVIGAVWVMLLGSFTTVFVYATLFSLPMALLASSLCLLLAGVNVLWSVLLLACCVASVVVIYLVKERVAVTASLLTCSSKALLQNFAVFFIAIILSMVQVVWLFICFLFIGLSFLSGEAVRVWVHTADGPDEERCVWQTDGWAYVGMFFVIFVMLWTNSIIGEIKRYTVCGAIGLWYYGQLPRSQARRPPQGAAAAANNTSAVSSPTLTSLGWSLRTSFGSVCFSALVASTCEGLKLVFRPWEYNDNHVPGRRKKDQSTSLRESIWFCLEDVIGFVNRFAVPLMAISGYPFCHSAKVHLYVSREIEIEIEINIDEIDRYVDIER